MKVVKYYRKKSVNIERGGEQPCVAYMRDELVKLWFSNQILKVEQEVKALLIGNARESIIRILAFQVCDQFGELVV